MTGGPGDFHERLTGQPWDDSYRDTRPPWDAGRPHAAVVRLAEEGAFAGRVLDAGCGTGENAIEVAARGLEVLGVDVAPTAIEVARSKAAARGVNLDFLVGDALQLGRLGREFQTILDCGLFHTFDDQERQRYVDSLATVTARGGLVHLLCFNDTTPGNGGPRHVSQAELRSAFRDGWRVVRIDADRYETKFDKQGAPAWLARIERR
ncbi:class I SAM-dependent methyltransferase [Microlunatus sp. GCM10028923]|uniref:class I SAM-dependent methyltransferase n=1 Tax=Microlunatus sp. GCM10028923 TaxID=3273400 RepID=UPI0036151B33